MLSGGVYVVELSDRTIKTLPRLNSTIRQINSFLLVHNVEKMLPLHSIQSISINEMT